jgi:hypothetical protein
MLKDSAPDRPVRSIIFFARVATQGRNYASVVGWLLHWAFKGRTRTLITALGFSGLYLAGQAAGIYTIYWYARKLETGGIARVPHLGIEFAARTTPELLWGVVIVSALCFIGSATFHFLSRRLVFSIVEYRYAKSLGELAQQAGRLPDARARTASRLLMNYGLPSVTAGCRFGLLTTVIFCNAISGMLGGVAATLFLFRIDGSLTLLILLTAGLGALLLYPLTLRAVRFAKDRERTQSAYQREARSVYTAPSDQTLTELKTPSGLARAHFGMWRVNAEVIYAIEIGKTFILAVVIYYMASEMMAGRQNWAILIAYVGALRLALMACSQAIRAYASVSRYYPQISRYHIFVKDLQNIDGSALGKVRRGETLNLGVLANGADIWVTVGERVALASADSLRELQFALLHARASSSAAPLGVALLDPADPKACETAALIFINPDQLTDASESELAALIAKKVALVVHRNTAKIGAFGEQRLLVVEEGEFRRLEILGGPESDAALEEYSRRIRQRRKQSSFDDDEADDDDDDDL